MRVEPAIQECTCVSRISIWEESGERESGKKPQHYRSEMFPESIPREDLRNAQNWKPIADVALRLTPCNLQLSIEG
ncbi:hypothetical protein NECAME_04525 [Necator americanus]|uniref:Uncharacterized protein n=1 Tax=Necator americanus TaxID=51031 RepID=W2SQP0_NECAM|nr:hypothetical protein NECAME_04525 [Necator americanus]ETN72054.1 hypothetical protein NECAME_04525 [Necator americanus]